MVLPTYVETLQSLADGGYCSSRSPVRRPLSGWLPQSTPIRSHECLPVSHTPIGRPSTLCGRLSARPGIRTQCPDDGAVRASACGASRCAGSVGGLRCESRPQRVDGLPHLGYRGARRHMGRVACVLSATALLALACSHSSDRPAA